MVIGDLTLDTIGAGLDALNVRRQASEDAVANMETPGYVAGKVDFESELARAVDSGDPKGFSPTITATSDPALPNGNNVDVAKELTSLSDTALRHQLLIEAANSKFRLLRTVIGT